MHKWYIKLGSIAVALTVTTFALIANATQILTFFGYDSDKLTAALSAAKPKISTLPKELDFMPPARPMNQTPKAIQQPAMTPLSRQQVREICLAATLKFMNAQTDKRKLDQLAILKMQRECEMRRS